MRRVLFGFLVLTASVLGAPGAGAAPPPGHGGGPACADIVGVGGSFLEPTLTEKAKITPKLELAADSCRAFTYTVYVLDETGTTLLTSQEVRGGGGTTVQFESIFLPAGVNAACVYVTSGVGRHVFDRAPAEGCIVLQSTGDPGDYEWFP
jgi:hypothetical protein